MQITILTYINIDNIDVDVVYVVHVNINVVDKKRFFSFRTKISLEVKIKTVQIGFLPEKRKMVRV